MPEFEHEKYLRETMAEAWEAYRLSLGLTHTQAFSAAVAVYERELRKLLSADEESDRDYADEMRAVSRARDLAYEELDSAPSDRLQSIIAELDKVLGPDLVREADPTGKVLKSLPYEERKALLDAFDFATAVAKERGAEEPPFVVILEDETGPLLEEARQKREALEVGSPEHDAFCMDETAKMAAEDVARGEGE